MLLSLLALAAFPAAALAGGKGHHHKHKKHVEVQLLGLNDFHGHLESNTPGTIAPAPGAERIPAGGAEYLATHLRQKERTNRRNTLLSKWSRDVVGVSANNQVVTQNVFKAMDITQLIQRYDAIAAPLRDRVIGRISADITRTPDDSGESAAGNLIADAQHAATAPATTGSAVAAFMNPGGVRADFTFAPSGSEAPGEVTYGEAFTVQPFGNSLVTMTLTGAQLLEMLKQQWCGASSPRVLLPSASVGYTFDQSVASDITGDACAGAANPVTNLTIGGTAVDPAASYRITVNSFLADGGDSFPVLREGSDRLGGEVDTDALEDYIAPSLTGAPVAPPALDRIDVTP